MRTLSAVVLAVVASLACAGADARADAPSQLWEPLPGGTTGAATAGGHSAPMIVAGLLALVGAGGLAVMAIRLGRSPAPAPPEEPVRERAPAAPPPEPGPLPAFRSPPPSSARAPWAGDPPAAEGPWAVPPDV